MTNSPKHIVIAHKSHIVFHGLSAIFRNHKVNFDSVHVLSLQQLENHMLKNSVEWVFVSPQLILNCEEKFQSLKSRWDVRWIGILQDSFPRNIIELFDNVIYLDDTENDLSGIFHTTGAKDSETLQTNIEKSLLSERELDVLRLMVQGLSNKEVADKLFISTHTVITHRKNISQKTGIKTVSGLTIFAVVNKLVELDNYF